MSEIIPSIPQAVEKYDDSTFRALSSASAFLPRIQVMGSSAKECKSGAFPIGNWGLFEGKNLSSLDKEFNAVVLAWRAKALDLSNTEEIISSYDPKSAEFQRIQHEAGIKDSNCMFGAEFLLYIPSKKLYVTFFCGNKTAQTEAPNIRKYIGRMATLRVIYIPSKKYGGWHGPQAVPCSQPPENLPPTEEMQAVMDKFLNPPAQQVETAEKTDNDRAR